MAEAERLTGMKQQRVSELGKRLADEESYLRHLVGAEYFAAFLEMPLPRGAQGTGAKRMVHARTIYRACSQGAWQD